MHRACLESYFLLRWMAGNTICSNRQCEAVVDCDCRWWLSRGWHLALTLALPSQIAEKKFWLCEEDKAKWRCFHCDPTWQNGGEHTEAPEHGLPLQGQPPAVWSKLTCPLPQQQGCFPEQLQGGDQEQMRGHQWREWWSGPLNINLWSPKPGGCSLKYSNEIAASDWYALVWFQWKLTCNCFKWSKWGGNLFLNWIPRILWYHNAAVKWNIF